MSNNQLKIITKIAAPIVTIMTTIALFFIFKPQETTSLFWINLFYTVFLEAVIFCYLIFLREKPKDSSTPLFAIYGIFYLYYYIILGSGCMILYSFILRPVFLPDTHKIYIATLIALTLLWIIILEITLQSGNKKKESVETLKKRGQSLNFYNQKIVSLASRYEKLCNKKGLKYETLSCNRTELDRLKGKISFLTPNVFMNEMAVAHILALFSKCEDIIDEMEKATGENREAVQKKCNVL